MRVRTHTNPLTYRDPIAKLDLDTVFKTPVQHLDLEIGFGRGIFLRQYAHQHPERHIVGIEVRKQIVDILNERLDQDSISNAYLIHGNGEVCLNSGFENHTIERLFVFHPDPWFKKRHHKRRVVSLDFLKTAHAKLKKNGRLYLSTDVPELWDDMQEKLSESALFSAVDDPEFWENSYSSHWHVFSEKTNRSIHTGAFQALSS